MNFALREMNSKKHIWLGQQNFLVDIKATKYFSYSNHILFIGFYEIKQSFVKINKI